MSRLSNLRRDELDERGQQVWDAINAGRGAAAVRADGGLAGPFNAWVHAPDVGARLLDLGSALRFGTSIDRRLLELAIITVAAHWKAEFEWWAHARMAREQGVDKDIIEAIGRGGPVQPSRDDERIVHAAALQLVAEGKLAASTYQEAYSLLGDQAMVELVSLCGYYSLVSYVLNAFEVPLPPDVPPRWDEGTVSEERASP